jgi:uncharacterized protein (TIGR00288 family)
LVAEERLKIAVFVDFDNIEIGVRNTLSRKFDIGSVLEAIKERGEVITKIAYGDWKRAEDYSRAMTQHAVQMVQRNLTPGGDKNGADITLALDALEMAFTREHINAFVIVGGDSDFIALVEKLKQYGKTVFIVGGRAFTSVILQRNCHEFIAYENLVSIQPSARKTTGKAPAQTPAQLERALPLLRRALKVLSDREVSPQLGLLKSTLLQLDSTFSERDFGTSTFREFIQRMANAGFVNLKQVDRSLLVELKDGETAAAPAPPPPDHAAPPPPAPVAPADPLKASDGVRAMREVFQNAKTPPRWPMYLRTVKQFLRANDPSFDERRYGFSSIHDLIRQAQRDGFLRLERNRQGVLMVFPDQSLRPEARETREEAQPAVPIEEAPAPMSEIPAIEVPLETTGEPALDLQLQPVQASETEVPPAEEKRKPQRRARTASSGSKRRSTATRKSRTSPKERE